MKKLLLSAAAVLVASLSFGQAKWGIVAGPQFSSIASKNAVLNSGKETSSILTGIRAGITVDIPLADEFYIGTGLLYSGKGGKAKNSDVKTTLSYLELPLHFMFKPEVGSGKLVLSAGPYFAYGVGGKIKNTILGDLNVYDDEALLAKQKRFDAGVGINVGYEMPMGLYFGLNTDLGLVNTAENTDNDRRFKNTSFGVSVGYKFGGR
ncbi:porin family protein [Chitinophaga arvensicola]|uniref:Outer membrane insertion C-terminal signal n=1 Tax=Chitinophaga arvensicola TaxID=29529 RepID=A0A1I0P356_9BACT|nr:porin family protein [Chitinophaga arvensicola]SEW08596.1 outer membrane insertion C-terminal signal [Chitinophaga arvensicola]